MKKLLTVFVLLVFVLIGAAVWYSPFAFKDARVYENNVAEGRVGVCYPSGASVRYDLDGDEPVMYAELEDLMAKPVKTVQTDGLTVVYAYSPRVCAAPRSTEEGGEYNVMAAYRNGHIAVGAPVLEGSY